MKNDNCLLVEHWQKAKQYNSEFVAFFHIINIENCVWNKKINSRVTKKWIKTFSRLVQTIWVCRYEFIVTNFPPRPNMSGKQRKLRVFYEISKFFIFIGFFSTVSSAAMLCYCVLLYMTFLLLVHVSHSRCIVYSAARWDVWLSFDAEKMCSVSQSLVFCAASLSLSFMQVSFCHWTSTHKFFHLEWAFERFMFRDEVFQISIVIIILEKQSQTKFLFSNPIKCDSFYSHPSSFHRQQD
jgi:hypothetical protein